MTFILGLNGDAGSGKDTAAEYLVEWYGFKRIGFADAVKDIALAIDPIICKIEFDPFYLHLSSLVQGIGWDHAKRSMPEVRRLLQNIGTEAGRQVLGENVWVDIVKRKIDESNCPAIVITDLRFPNEASFVADQGGIVVRIERPENPHAIAKTHASEQFVPDADFIITNENDNLVSFHNQLDGIIKDSNWLRRLLPDLTE